MPLSLEDDPDRQIQMPFAAADDYARHVMAGSRDTLQGRPDGMAVSLDVAYGPHRLHRYDVFSPQGARDAPVLVFWHGGGWTNGYRAYNHFLARQAVAMGCVLVTPSYRLVTEAKFPAAFDDALAALGHIAGHIQAQGGCGHKLLLSGHSAGGHLAALVALRVAEWRRAGLDAGQIRACLPVSGIMDLHHPSPPPGSLEERVYAMVLAHPDQDAAMSPISWTAGNRVPFVLTVGEKDSERVRRSNQRLLVLLALQNAPAVLRQMPGQDHFQTHTSLAEPGHPWWQALASAMAQPPVA